MNSGCITRPIGGASNDERIARIDRIASLLWAFIVINYKCCCLDIAHDISMMVLFCSYYLPWCITFVKTYSRNIVQVKLLKLQKSLICR